eukprot:3143347-Pyramimonas_sp.AAC.1
MRRADPMRPSRRLHGRPVNTPRAWPSPRRVREGEPLRIRDGFASSSVRHAAQTPQEPKAVSC